MPSKAYRRFIHNAVDVDRIISSHSALHNGSTGRKGLGHITRSGVVMLCAAWELYVEDLLIECVKYIAENNDSPNTLPDAVQKNIAKKIKEHKNDLKVLELSGYGWRNIYISYCENETRLINTPKATILDPIYKKYIGLESLSNGWSLGSNTIKDFVSVRRGIAHKGRSSGYITLIKLIEYNDCIKFTAKEMDNYICTYVYGLVNSTIQPWRKIKS